MYAPTKAALSDRLCYPALPVMIVSTGNLINIRKPLPGVLSIAMVPRS
jgi:hypothetical protein